MKKNTRTQAKPRKVKQPWGWMILQRCSTPWPLYSACLGFLPVKSRSLIKDKQDARVSWQVFKIQRSGADFRGPDLTLLCLPPNGNPDRRTVITLPGQGAVLDGVYDALDSEAMLLKDLRQVFERLTQYWAAGFHPAPASEVH